MAAPLITLLTDFGLSDHYVAVMKGVIFGICPEARIVDISHDVPAYGIVSAAYLLSQAWPHFPPGTIHVVVVDPGVGSVRRPILVKLAEHFCVGPDNGVFSMLEPQEVRHITSDRYFRHPVSRTFHGRDIFAPVAAHLASGVLPSQLGPAVAEYARLSLSDPTQDSAGLWTGSILHVDGFGNIITNFGARKFTQFRIVLNGQSVAAFARNYAEAPIGLFLIEGSSGYWEISAKQKSAAEMLRVRAGDPIHLSLPMPNDAGVRGL